MIPRINLEIAFLGPRATRTVHSPREGKDGATKREDGEGKTNTKTKHPWQDWPQDEECVDGVRSRRMHRVVNLSLISTLVPTGKGSVEDRRHE